VTTPSTAPQRTAGAGAGGAVEAGTEGAADAAAGLGGRGVGASAGAFAAGTGRAARAIVRGETVVADGLVAQAPTTSTKAAKAIRLTRCPRFVIPAFASPFAIPG
jgi:hypothetical protein